MLIFGVLLLWRQSLEAYISSFRWQSIVLAGILVMIGYFGDDPELYAVAAVMFVLKGLILPHYLNRMRVRLGVTRETEPYVNNATSLILAGLLVMLAERPGSVRTREDIIDQVWDAHWFGPTKTLDVHVSALRRKLGHPEWIATVRGVGYRLEAVSYTHLTLPTIYSV